VEDEKPLHVRVAEALGWTAISACRHCEDCNDWLGSHPEDYRSLGVVVYIPNYDTDWSATGPLIERYGVALTPPGVLDAPGWAASIPQDRHAAFVTKQPTPLLAVCHLILALAAGKL